MSTGIEALAARVTRGAADQREQAVRLHDFVRDQVAFGFAPQRDGTAPEHTLAAGVGDTLQKTALFVDLLRAAGFQAFMHFATIDRDLLRGIFPHGAHRLLPWEIAHAYTDVEIAQRWCSLDSYALDRPFWHAALARLKSERLMLGYGAHRLGTCRWSGEGNAFAQLASPDMVVEDLGVFEDLDAAPRHGHGNARASAAWSRLFAFAGDPDTARSARACINAHLKWLRAGMGSPPETAPPIRSHASAAARAT